MDEGKYLTGQIKSWRRRINLARGIDGSVCGAAAGGFLGLLCEAVSLFVPFYSVHLAAAGCFLAGGMAGAVYAFTRRIDMEQAARRLDSFGFSERLVTAWEQMGRDDRLAKLQRQDAVDHYNRRRGEIRIPVLPDKRHMLALVLSVVMAAGTGWIPSPARQQAKLLHEVQEKAGEEQEELKELVEALKEVESLSLTDGQRQELGELLEALRRSQEELAQADSRESLAAVTERLNYKYNQAAQKLESLAASYPQEAGIADAKALAKAAANREGTQTAANGGEAKKAGENGGDGTSGDGGDSGDGKNSGQGNGSGKGEGSGEGEGNGSGKGSGEGEGNGGGEGSGQGNGSGEGEGSGQGSGEGSGQGNGGGRGTGSSDRVHDYISVPGELSDDGSLTGQKDGDAHSDYYRRQNGLAWEGEHVDYRSVVGDYTNRAYEGLAGGRYPAGMESVIRDYFESLAD